MAYTAGAGMGAGAVDIQGEVASLITPVQTTTTNISLKEVLKPSATMKRKTKIVCTIGPACNTVETLVAMIKAGMSVARLNFSHGDHESHRATLANVREAAERCKAHVAVMLDTKGPEIRTGTLKTKDISLTRGQTLTLTTDYTYEGDSNKIAISYKALPTSVKAGDVILVADGSLSLKVLSCGTDEIETEVLNAATIGHKKNVNLPGIEVKLPTITPKDTEDILTFARHIDMVALSFARSAADIHLCRELLDEDDLPPQKRRVQIIPKIENQEGLFAIDEIVEACDGLMVARGDMGMEIELNQVTLAQKMLINKCNAAGKPVIVATEMLQSMCGAPRPTRAECSDVANAVLEGAYATMLSGETAGGKYPLQAVEYMSKICATAESIIDFNARYTSTRMSMVRGGKVSVSEAMSSSAVKIAIDIGATAIIVVTQSGGTASLIAKYSPAPAVIAVCDTATTARKCALLRGVTAYHVETVLGSNRVIQGVLSHIRAAGVVASGDFVVVVHGTVEGQSGATDLVRVTTVPEGMAVIDVARHK